MADRRATRTKAAIRQAFLTLLNTKTISKITILEITELANIGRGTFYLHYQDIYALYEEIEQEMLKRMDQLYDESFPIQDRRGVVHFIQKLTDYIYENRALFRMLADPENTLLTPNTFKGFFKTKVLQEILTERALSHPPTVLEETESLFIVSGVFGVIQDWIERGMEEEPTGMSLRIEQLLLKLEEE